MRPLKSVSKGSLLCFLLTAPVLMSGTTSSSIATPSLHKALVVPATETAKSTKEIILDEAVSLYDPMQLQRAGLNKKAFELAWQGYKQLVQTGRIRKTDVLSICDFSQSSRRKRLYIIDVEEQKLLIQTFVAHGRNSGGDYVGSNFIKMNKFNGRSFGCPAVPAKDTKKVINTIKNGSCLFIYHPTKNYL